MMKTNVRKHSVDSVEEGLKEQFLHAASSYLRIPDDEEMLVLRKGNSHSFCKIPEPIEKALSHFLLELEAPSRPNQLVRPF
jgi:hypothetical protein